MHRSLATVVVMILAPATVFGLDGITNPDGSPPWRAVGYYAHEEIRESSGVAVSANYPGVFWTLNDSGNPARIYATRLDGEVIQAFDVSGAENYDWEAMAIDDKGQLWIGEIGNNSPTLCPSTVSKPERQCDSIARSTLTSLPN